MQMCNNRSVAALAAMMLMGSTFAAAAVETPIYEFGD